MVLRGVGGGAEAGLKAMQALVVRAVRRRRSVVLGGTVELRLTVKESGPTLRECRSLDCKKKKGVRLGRPAAHTFGMQLALCVQFREKDKRRPSLVLSGWDEGQL